MMSYSPSGIALLSLFRDIFRLILASVYMVMVRVRTLFRLGAHAPVHEHRAALLCLQRDERDDLDVSRRPGRPLPRRGSLALRAPARGFRYDVQFPDRCLPRKTYQAQNSTNKCKFPSTETYNLLSTTNYQNIQLPNPIFTSYVFVFV